MDVYKLVLQINTTIKLGSFGSSLGNDISFQLVSLNNTIDNSSLISFIKYCEEIVVTTCDCFEHNQWANFNRFLLE